MQRHPTALTNLVAGARFVHQGHDYRLNSFLCEVQEKPVEHELLAGLFAQWDAEEAASTPPGMRRIKLRYCLPQEASFVSGSGVAGCVVAIEEIELDGMVEWSEQQLAEHHAEALRKGREGRYSATVLRPINPSVVA